MARKKREPVAPDTARRIGGSLRGLRKAAGYRAVQDAASAHGCPAARQTIYAYERGGLLPSLPQFLELIEFYVGDHADAALRNQAIAAIHGALTSDAYHVRRALELAERLQPPVDPGRRRKKR